MAAGSAGRKTPNRALQGPVRARSTPEEQKKIATDIQTDVYDQVIYVPLGQWLGSAPGEIARRRARRPGDAGVLEYR